MKRRPTSPRPYGATSRETFQFIVIMTKYETLYNRFSEFKFRIVMGCMSFHNSFGTRNTGKRQIWALSTYNTML